MSGQQQAPPVQRTVTMQAPVTKQPSAPPPVAQSKSAPAQDFFGDFAASPAPASNGWTSFESSPAPAASSGFGEFGDFASSPAPAPAASFGAFAAAPAPAPAPAGAEAVRTRRTYTVEEETTADLNVAILSHDYNAPENQPPVSKLAVTEASSEVRESDTLAQINVGLEC